MLLITGLGNPGIAYKDNRHNIGFMAVDAIHAHYNFQPFAKKFQSLIAMGEIHGQKIILQKPQTFMNLSGQAVGEAMRFYKLQPKNILVLHDELDIAFQKIRMKIGGGSGGHNGIKSIDAHCGINYKRIRLGIGHPGDKNLVHNYVLGNFSKAEQPLLDDFLIAIAKYIGLVVDGDDNGFMSRVAQFTSQNTGKESIAAKVIVQKTISETAKPLKAQSHIKQAQNTQKKQPPATGPMAEMLKRLFKKD